MIVTLEAFLHATEVKAAFTLIRLNTATSNQ